MFNRKSYKSIAKKQLKGRWTLPVLATLITFILTSLISAPENLKEIQENIVEEENSSRIFLEYSLPFAPSFPDFNNFLSAESFTDFSKTLSAQKTFYKSITISGGKNIGSFFPLDLLKFVLTYFVSGVLLMALTYLFVVYSHTREKQPFSVFLKGFTFYLDGFLGLLWHDLWTFLWGLLFIIPGIVKSYSYSMMFYILAEHPGIGVTKAMRMSKVMTRGSKGDLFIMDLSFIPWFILGLLSCGIAFLWIKPYYRMAKTNAYHALKSMSIQKGNLKEEDFFVNKEDDSADSEN